MIKQTFKIVTKFAQSNKNPFQNKISIENEKKRNPLKCAISGLQANILLKIRVLFHRNFIYDYLEIKQQHGCYSYSKI